MCQYCQVPRSPRLSLQQVVLVPLCRKAQEILGLSEGPMEVKLCMWNPVDDCLLWLPDHKCRFEDLSQYFSLFPRPYLKYDSSKQAEDQEDQSTKPPDPGNSILAEVETF